MAARYRPLFHFAPPSGWMNDPNGLVYFDGEYHLFYQHNPGEPVHARMHWGHAVSTDLVHWTHLPVALSPDALGEIFSGSVVVDADDTSGFFGGGAGLVAIFTHHSSQESPAGPEVQSIAYSGDRGRTWTPYGLNPVIANPGHRDFRDPKVFWHAPAGRWVMATVFHTDRVRLYTSPNLKDWTYCSEFGPGHGAHSGGWECPDMLELPVGGAGRTKWLLNVSSYHRTEMADHLGMQHFIGDFDGTAFTNSNPETTVLSTDYGPDNYAAVTWSGGPAADGRRLLLGWMSNWRYARDVPTRAWKGTMTIPRELRLRERAEGIRLVQVPAQTAGRSNGSRAFPLRVFGQDF